MYFFAFMQVFIKNSYIPLNQQTTLHRYDKRFRNTRAPHS